MGTYPQLLIHTTEHLTRRECSNMNKAFFMICLVLMLAGTGKCCKDVIKRWETRHSWDKPKSNGDEPCRYAGNSIAGEGTRWPCPVYKNSCALSRSLSNMRPSFEKLRKKEGA